MGTVIFHKPDNMSAVDCIKRELGAEWCEKHVVATAYSNGCVFIVGRFHKPDDLYYVPDADGYVRALLIFKLSLGRGEYNFGYKDMTEAMGPHGCEAPLSIIAKCSAPLPLPPGDEESGLASIHEYRARCAAHAEAASRRRKLVPGSVVVLSRAYAFGGVEHQRFTVDRARLRGRKGISTVFRADNGMLCGITTAMLQGATVEGPTQ